MIVRNEDLVRPSALSDQLVDIDPQETGEWLESLEAVITRWMDTHLTTEVYALDLHTTGRDGPLYMCITYKRERTARPATPR